MADWFSFKGVSVSLLAIIPVFVYLSATYIFFGHQLPPEPLTWAYWSLVTFAIGFAVTEFWRDEVDRKWAVQAGTARWIFVISAFALTELTKALGLGGIGDFSRLLTAQFLFELPAMILGYYTGLLVYEKLEEMEVFRGILEKF